MVLLVVLIILLLASMIQLRRNDYTALSNKMARRQRSALHVMKPCPICGVLLQKGERVHTIVYSGEPEGSERRPKDATRDAMVHMFGCPYCYPHDPQHERICPVCHEVLPPDGYVIARMFLKGERKHVHVLGCTECRSAAYKRRKRSDSGA